MKAYVMVSGMMVDGKVYEINTLEDLIELFGDYNVCLLSLDKDYHPDCDIVIRLNYGGR